MKKSTTLQIIVGLLLTVGIASLPISKWEDEFTNLWHLVGYEVIWWAMIMIAVYYVLRIEKRPLASIGFRPLGKNNILIAIASGIVMVVGLGVIYYVVLPALHLSEENQVNQLIATPFLWRFFSVIRAAVGEEILFRGYAIERLDELTGSRVVAAVLSCVIFTLDHVGMWGWSHVLLAGFGGVMLTALYLWRGNLWVNIIAHFIVDGLAVLG